MAMILGLTGGMGCGKSTAARFFVASGFRLLDSDQIVRDDLLCRPDVVAAIADRWPEAVDPSGRVRRPVLAGQVFADDADRLWLENLLHPRLHDRWREALAADPAARWVFEVPLLFEKKLENWFDFTICVATTSANQIARLTERGLPQALAEQRISKQLSLAKKIELADFVLCNDGTAAALQRQVLRLVAELAVNR